MSKSDGGPAFPRQLPDYPVPLDKMEKLIQAHAGMSLRDWFAGMALTGIEAGLGLDSQRFALFVEMARSEGGPVADVIGRECCEAADAILRALAEAENRDA